MNNIFVPDAEYNTNHLRWLDIVSTYQSPSTHILDRWRQEIISNQDAALAYFFALDFPHHKPHRSRRVVLETANEKYAFVFCLHIKNADLKALLDVIVSSNNIKIITRCICFLPNIHHKDFTRLKNAILNSGKPRYLFELAKILPPNKKSDIHKIQQILLRTKSLTYLRLFAEQIEGADIEVIEQVFLDSQDTKEIKKFARSIKKSKMRAFLLLA